MCEGGWEGKKKHWQIQTAFAFPYLNSLISALGHNHIKWLTVFQTAWSDYIIKMFLFQTILWI